ncbi:MAG TPA: hypothetical protein VEN28_16765 [Burkholderiaceae bacterium]|nr:hypothetical protein [Burkholderiaceae bacterium]
MSFFKYTAMAAAVAGLAASTNDVAGQQPPNGTALTIYSSAGPGSIAPEMYRFPGRSGVQGYAVVRQEREIEVVKGRNEVKFSDVAALIDPTTVVFESLTDPKGTSVLEQNFQFDLVSTEKLLTRYVDRQISVDQIRGQTTESFTGTLLSTQGGVVLKRDDGTLQILPHNAGVKLPALPGGLITRPTLVWNVDARNAGKQRTRVAYQTQGITWWADYNVTFAEARPGDCKLDVGAWVSIINTSGASYTDAKLKLVAGEVHRAAAVAGRMLMAKEQRVPASAPAVDGFAEKSFFEYHLYTLGRPTSLPDNSTKQIELFPVARSVPCQRTLVYYGRPDGGYGFLPSPATDRNYGVQSNKQVDVYLQFKNAESGNLGLPLPRGRVRVSKLDPADRTLEFIGEDSIDHTPKNEKVLLKMGSAFDVVGERRQVDFRIDTTRRTMSEDIEIKLRNAKNEPVEVQVKEVLYRWTNWEIVSSSQTYRKEDARNIYFPVAVPPGEEVTVRYSVRYSW